jgi:hypothetical protein
VQWEEIGKLRWLSEAEQKISYFSFFRKALLRMDALKRAQISEIRIRSGQMKPNEARADESENSYPGGNTFWMLNQNIPVERAMQPAAPNLTVTVPGEGK